MMDRLNWARVELSTFRTVSAVMHPSQSSVSNDIRVQSYPRNFGKEIPIVSADLVGNLDCYFHDEDFTVKSRPNPRERSFLLAECRFSSFLLLLVLLMLSCILLFLAPCLFPLSVYLTFSISISYRLHFAVFAFDSLLILVSSPFFFNKSVI